MAHTNEVRFLQRHAPKAIQYSTSVLEMGSKCGVNMMPWRTLFPSLIGTDIEGGEGVDIVHDFMQGPFPTQYELVLCCSVLEHTHKPWIVAQHTAASVQSGGYLYLTTPWTWRQHNYPIDWWRFSVEALKTLFPGFAWIAESYSTTEKGDFRSERSHEVWVSTIKEKKVNVVLTELSHLLGRKL